MIKNKFTNIRNMTFLVILIVTFIAISGCSSQATNTETKTATKINNPYLQKLADEKNKAPTAAEIKDGIQQIDMNIFSDRYEPSVIKLKKGIPTKFNIKSIDNFGCGRTLVMPSIKVYKELPENGEVILEAMPDKVGEGPITCSMGMFSGKVIVEE